MVHMVIDTLSCFSTDLISSCMTATKISFITFGSVAIVGEIVNKLVRSFVR